MTVGNKGIGVTGRGIGITGKSIWIVGLASAAALVMATGCGDDETSGDSGGGKGGTSPSGGSSGDAGEAGDSSGGTAGSSGSAGSAGTGGSAGTAGTDGGMGGEPAGGTGGAAGGDTGGTGGTDGGMGGQGGMGGEPIQYWPEGFTANGISTTVDDRFHGVAIQGQNVYATGYLGDGVVMTGTTRQVVVAKFDSQARLVTGFGNMGLATVDLSNYAGLPVDATNTTADPSQETGRDIALQSDGKIIVVGVVERVTAMPPDRTTPLDIFVMRFDATGMPDTTLFNGGANGGVLYLSPGTVPSTNPIAYGVEIDAMNRIYVFAHGNATHATRTDQDRYVYRLNADGTPDMNFGTGGFFTFDQPGATATNPMTDNVRRGAVLANGNVIVAGYTPIINGKNEIVLARVLPGGTPDPSFSANGINTFRPYDDDGMAECYGVGVQSDGSLVTTGYGNPNTANSGSQFLDMISIRVRPDGRQDTTWAGSGRLSLDINSLEDRGRDILALPDDRILIAGAGTLTTGDKDSMLLLLDKDGMPTEDFVMDGTSRRLYGSFGSPGDEFFAVAQSPGTTGARMVAAAGYAPAGASLANGNGTLAVIPVPAP